MKISKETKIGLTGVAALVLLFFGINFLKGVKLFSTQSTYYIKFANAKALSKNSTVYADGYNIGIVSNVLYDYSKPGQVLVEISVNKGLRIPKGSTAKLDEAVLGGCTLNLLLVNNLTEAYAPGDTIQGSDGSGLMSKAADMMPQVEQVVARVDTSKDIPQMTTTFNKAGENVVTLTDNLNQLKLQATMDSVNAAISSIHEMMAQMQSPDGTLGKMMNDPALYNNLNHTVQSADSLVTDLKKNPKRYVHFSVFGKKQ